MGVGESFDRLVNVLTIVNSDRPFLMSLHRVLRGGAHRGIRICFFNDRCLVRRVSGLVSEIVERDNRAFESNFAQVLGADLIQCAICLSDPIFH